MKHLFALTLIIFSALIGIVFAHPALAGTFSDINEQMNAAGGSAGLQGTDPRQTIGYIIFMILGLIGIIVTGLMVYAGYLWLTAGGNDDQITSAKTTIRNCVIGLVITLSAYAITFFVTRVALGQYEGQPIYLLDKIFRQEVR